MDIDKVIKTAKQIISGDIGVIQGSRDLLALCYPLKTEERDTYFMGFIVIDSDSDHIPLGVVREHWSEAALKRIDLEKKEIEEHYYDLAIKSSKKVVEHYSGK